MLQQVLGEVDNPTTQELTPASSLLILLPKGDWMPRPPLQRIQAITVARRYFIERQTKSRIADDLAISRFKVARLIDEAIEEIIRDQIRSNERMHAQLTKVGVSHYFVALVQCLLPPI